MKYLILLALIPQITLADNAVDLKQGQSAPFDGVLMDKERAGIIKNQLIDGDTAKELNKSYDTSIKLYRSNEDILNQKSNLLLNQNLELTKAINESKETSDLTKIGYFTLGVIVTGAAVYGASKLAK